MCKVPYVEDTIVSESKAYPQKTKNLTEKLQIQMVILRPLQRTKVLKSDKQGTSAALKAQG